MIAHATSRLSFRRYIKEHRIEFVGVGNIHHIIINSHIARLDKMVALQLLEESRIEIHILFVDGYSFINLHLHLAIISLAYRYYIVRLFIRNLLFGIGLGILCITTHSQSSQLCPNILIIIDDGLFYHFLLLVYIIKMEHLRCISQGTIHLVLFFLQTVEDTEVGTDVRIVTTEHQIMNVWHTRLLVTVNATIALFKCNQTPRDVVIEHSVTIIVKVDTLRTCITTDKHTYR